MDTNSTEPKNHKSLSDIDAQQLTMEIEKVLGSITDFLGIELQYDYEIENYENKEGETRELIKLKLSSNNDPLLIGYHGRTLEALQHLLGLGLSNSFKQIVRVSIDVGSYRDKRTSALENLARRAAQQVMESGQILELEPMNAAERRIVHNALMSEDQVVTESTGEGRDRRVVVKPRIV